MRRALPAALLILLVGAAFFPAARNGWIWDDDTYITANPLVQSPHGAASLNLIWTQIGATPQYYPLTFTLLRFAHDLWDNHPVGYHILGLALHAGSAILLWLVCRELGLRRAAIIAAAWAVHPMQVETVAWAAETKNALSAVFYFSAMLAYLKAAAPTRFDRPKPALLLLAIALFILGLLSKTVVGTLPGALLVLGWWKTGRVTVRQVLYLLPMFALAVAAGSLTTWMEIHVVGASGPDWQRLTTPDRIGIAAHALWFYLAKTFWPVHYAFIYPRWNPALSTVPVGFIIATLTLAIAITLLTRRLGRGLPAAALLFAGTLVPALGFADLYPMRFSFVAEHFAYLAIAAPIALIIESIPGRARSAIAIALVIPLPIITNIRCNVFADSPTLWQANLDADPNSWVAYSQLGNLALEHHNLDEAAGAFEKSIQLNSDFVEPHLGMADVFLARGFPDAAIAQCNAAIALRPQRLLPHWHAAAIFAKLGRTAAERTELSDVLDIEPRYEPARIALGRLFLADHQLDDAAAQAQLVLDNRPQSFDAALLLADVWAAQGRTADAIGYYRRLLAEKPGDSAIRQRLASLGATP